MTLDDAKRWMAKHYRWKRAFVIAFSMGVILCSWLSSSVRLDLTVLILLLIVIISVLWPEIALVLPFIRMVKVGNIEFELNVVQEQVTEAKESVEERGIGKVQPEIYESVRSILDVASKSPRSALLDLAVRIEATLRARLIAAQAIDEQQYLPLMKMSNLAFERGLITKETLSAIKGFYSVRNQAAHGLLGDLDKDVIIAVLDIGIDLLKLIAVENQ